MKYVGIDGCPGGWFLISIDQDANFYFNVFDHIDQLWNDYKDSTLILIDIPIGLPHWRSRRCDVEARKLLGKRGSSVFPAPSREAINEPDYEHACKVNQKILGKKLSIQAWNISPKIKQVDLLMGKEQFTKNAIRESHPEICFWALAGGKTIVHNKKTEQGIEERLSVLKNINRFSEEIYNKAIQTFKRKDLAKDDILDALTLAITAASPSNTLHSIPEHPERDLKNLPMEIVFTNQFLDYSKI
jgi:predicted RNase H-like nuclease